MCIILWCILYTWEALGCMFSNLSLDSCIVNKGEKKWWRKVALHPWNQSQESRGTLCISFAFLAFVGCGLLYLAGFGNRSDRFVPRVGTCSGGVCICAGGALVCFGGLCSLLEHSFVSDVSSRCPCLRGPRLVFFKWSFSLLFFGFRSLVEVSFICFFSFFLSGYYMCVLPMHSSRGRLKTICGWRTSGWLLPGVMSDWQRCVDWFLAKYCRCRLRLDWCWCRCRTSAKGRCRWGLQVWIRQVGFVRWTWWPAGSSAGHMVARMARWSHGRFLGWASKPRSSWDYVGAESWVAIGGGYTEFAGFPVVHQNNRVPWLIHKAKTEARAWLSGQNRPDRFGESVWPVWGRRAPKASRWRTRVGIARLRRGYAKCGRRASVRWCYEDKFPKCPW
jgi:hypothetical protein